MIVTTPDCGRRDGLYAGLVAMLRSFVGISVGTFGRLPVLEPDLQGVQPVRPCLVRREHGPPLGDRAVDERSAGDQDQQRQRMLRGFSMVFPHPGKPGAGSSPARSDVSQQRFLARSRRRTRRRSTGSPSRRRARRPASAAASSSRGTGHRPAPPRTAAPPRPTRPRSAGACPCSTTQSYGPFSFASSASSFSPVAALRASSDHFPAGTRCSPLGRNWMAAAGSVSARSSSHTPSRLATPARLVQLRVAEVEVHQQRLVPALGQAAGQAERGERLPLVAERAGDGDGRRAAGQPRLGDVGPELVDGLVRGRGLTGSGRIAVAGQARDHADHRDRRRRAFTSAERTDPPGHRLERDHARGPSARSP